MLALLVALAAADPLPLPTRSPGGGELSGPGDGPPIADSPRSVGRAVAERTIAAAARDAVDRLGLKVLVPPSYALRIEVEEGAEELGEPVGEAVVARLAMLDRTVSREAPDQLVLRVASTGLVRELESRTLPVKYRTGAPWTLVSVGVPVLVIGGLVSAINTSATSVGPAAMLLGGTSVAVGVGLFARPPKQMQVRCAAFTADVAVTLTWYSRVEGVAPVVLEGAGHARVSDEDAPCTGKMSRLRRQM